MSWPSCSGTYYVLLWMIKSVALELYCDSMSSEFHSIIRLLLGKKSSMISQEGGKMQPLQRLRMLQVLQMFLPFSTVLMQKGVKTPLSEFIFRISSQFSCSHHRFSFSTASLSCFRIECATAHTS